MESRSDSLAAELQRQGIFDDYFAYYFRERRPFAERLEWLEEKGVKASAGALHRLHHSPEASAWRMAEAARAEEELSSSLPTNLPDRIRRSLASARFNAVLGELSHQELMDHFAVEKGAEEIAIKREQLEVRKRELALTQDKFEVQTCEKFLAWFADQKAREIAESEAPNATKIAQLRQLYFADVDAMEKSGAVQLPD
jgi:hypothetical protein